MADKNKIILGTNADTYIAADEAGNIVLQHEGGQRVSLTNDAILPSENETLDLGSAEKKFKDLYLSNNTIYMGDNNTPLSLSTDGKLTIDGAEVGGSASPELITEIRGYDFGAGSVNDAAPPYNSYVVPMGGFRDYIGGSTIRNSFGDTNLIDLNEGFARAIGEAFRNAFLTDGIVGSIRTPKDNSIYAITTKIIKYDQTYFSVADFPPPGPGFYAFESGNESTRTYEFKHIFKPGNALSLNGALTSGNQDNSISYPFLWAGVPETGTPPNNLQRWRWNQGDFGGSGGQTAYTWPTNAESSQNQVDLGGVVINVTQNNGLPSGIIENGTFIGVFNNTLTTPIMADPDPMLVILSEWDGQNENDVDWNSASFYNDIFNTFGTGVFDVAYAYRILDSNRIWATKLDYKITVEKIQAFNLPEYTTP